MRAFTNVVNLSLKRNYWEENNKKTPRNLLAGFRYDRIGGLSLNECAFEIL